MRVAKRNCWVNNKDICLYIAKIVRVAKQEPKDWFTIWGLYIAKIVRVAKQSTEQSPLAQGLYIAKIVRVAKQFGLVA